MAVYLLSDAAADVTGQTYTVVGGRIGLWNQPREIRSIIKDGRWSPEEIADRFSTLGTEKLPFFEIMEQMQKASAAAGDPPADSSSAAAS